MNTFTNPPQFIAWISKGKISIFSIEETFTTTHVADFEWSYKNLNETLQEIKHSVGNHFLVLLSDEFTYLATVSVPKGLQNEHTALIQEAQNLIPEDFTNILWDFKDIPDPDIISPHDTKHVQIAAIDKVFGETLIQALETNSIEVTTMIPESYALAYLTKDQKEPHIIVHNNPDSSLILLAYKGIVTISIPLTEKMKNEKISKFIDFAKEYFGVSPKTLIYSGLEISKQTLPDQELNTEQLLLDPLKGTCMINAGGNTEIGFKGLNFVDILLQKFNKRTRMRPRLQNKFDTKTKITLGIFLLAIVLFVSASFINFSSTKDDSNGEVSDTSITLTNQEPSPSPEPSPTHTPTPAPFDKTQYEISILNGSGVPGTAKTTKNILEQDGFVVASTGNADYFGYAETIFRYKESINKLFISELKDTLGGDYVIGESIAEEDVTDLIIIIGAN